MFFPIPSLAVAFVAPPPPPAITRQTLPTGIHLIVSPRPQAQLVALEIRVRGAGSGYETAKENGLAHAVEHMVFKGTDTKLPGAFDAAFERMGGEASAQTMRDGTAFRTCVLPEHWKDAFSLWGELLQKPAFRESDWIKERTVIEREMRVAQSDTQKLGLQTLASIVYPVGDPYQQPIMGSVSGIQQFTINDLKTFHANHYQPANLTITVSGPVTAEEVVSVVNSLWSAPGLPITAAPSPPAPESTSVVTRAPLYTDEEQTARKLATVYLGFRAPRLQTDPNGAAAGDVLAVLLTQGTNGFLTTRLQNDPKLYSLSVNADYLPQTDRGLFVIYATGAKYDIGRIEDALVDELEKRTEQFAKGGETLEALLESAKASVLGEEKYRRETVEGEAQYLASLDMIHAPEGYAEKYAERVRAVSLPDISRLLERYVTPSKRFVSVIGLAAKGAPVIREATGANNREPEAIR